MKLKIRQHLDSEAQGMMFMIICCWEEGVMWAQIVTAQQDLGKAEHQDTNKAPLPGSGQPDWGQKWLLTHVLIIRQEDSRETDYLLFQQHC